MVTKEDNFENNFYMPGNHYNTPACRMKIEAFIADDTRLYIGQ